MRLTRLALPTLLLGLLAACNSAAGPGTGPGAPPTSTSGCPSSVIVTADDAGKQVCVALHGTVTVQLATPSGAAWTPVEASGAALSQSVAPPQPGTTSALAAYTAVAQGQATLSSSRPSCPAAPPGGVQCHSILRWEVTVLVK